MSSIISALGGGSGIDTQALVDQLATASREPKDKALAKRETANKLQISTLGTLSSGIDAFASSLSSLIAGGSLFTQPSSSNAALVSTTAVPGARLGTLSAQLEVLQLAQAQSVVSDNLAGINSPVGQGKLVLTSGGEDYDIVIDSTNDSLVGLARAINAANAGVTAAIVEDSNGARLTIKGQTGESAAFTLALDPAADPLLGRFAFAGGAGGGGQMTRAQEAKDAIVKLDGVEVHRLGNSFSDLIPGVRIDLKKAEPGTTVSIGSVRPNESITAALSDFAAAYNEVLALLKEATSAGAVGSSAGPLRGDVGAQQMLKQLSRLTSTKLVESGSPATLAEIGVSTNRDGTLRVDGAALQAALTADPGAVEALFNPGQRSSSPFITITSPMGRAKPGTYELKDIVPSDGTSLPSGTIAGLPAVPGGLKLIASITSKADGLVIEPTAAVASATVTADLGLGGALQQIRDALRAATGPLAATSNRLTAATTALSEERTKMEARETAYRERLVVTYAQMEKRVSAFKATQSYLDQQIKVWTQDKG